MSVLELDRLSAAVWRRGGLLRGKSKKTGSVPLIVTGATVAFSESTGKLSMAVTVRSGSRSAACDSDSWRDIILGGYSDSWCDS